MRNKIGTLALSTLCAVMFLSNALAADLIGEPGRDSGKPNPLNNVYFGGQHLHTVASPDAFAFGTRNDTNDAYRYARGAAIRYHRENK